MRRRGPDFRRPARRRIPNVFWLTLCGLVILLFIVLLSRENQHPTSRSVYTKVISDLVLFLHLKSTAFVYSVLPYPVVFELGLSGWIPCGFSLTI